MISHILSRYWWATLLRGVLWILFGFVVFAQPGISLVALTLLFGVLALADGMTLIASAIGGVDFDNWWVLLLVGLAGLAVGALTFFSPGATAIMLLFFIAMWAIATGILQIVAAVQLRKEIEGEFWLGLAGLVSVAFGLFLAARPAAGALAVLWLIAGYAITFGTILVALAIETRAFANRIEAS